MEQENYVSNLSNNISNRLSGNGQHSPSSSSISSVSSSSNSSPPSSAAVLALFSKNNQHNHKLSETLITQQRKLHNHQLNMNGTSIGELQKTLSTTSCFGLRQDHMYNLSANLLHHFQPHFLNPNLTAFRPLSTTFKNFSSAFSQPSHHSNKCLKMDAIQSIFQMKKIHNTPAVSILTNEHYHHKTLSTETRRHSPNQNTTNSVQIKDEQFDFQNNSDSESEQLNQSKHPEFFRIFGNNYNSTTTNTCPLPSGTNSNFTQRWYGPTNLEFDQGNQNYRQNNKRKRDSSQCPICGTELISNELNTHLLHELDQLYQFNRNHFCRNKSCFNIAKCSDDVASEGRQEAFQRIKRNRQSRLKIKIRKRKGDDPNSCSICSDKCHEGDQCLRKNQNDEDETVDIEGDDENEAVLDEWTSANNYQESKHTLNAVSPNNHCWQQNLKVGSNEDKPIDQSQVDTVNSSVDIIDNSTNHSSNIQCDSSNNEPNTTGHSNRLQLILELRRKIQQLENHTTNDHCQTDEHFKCQICTEIYKEPVVSISCWHVHCESCWDKLLQLDQTCPQCNTHIDQNDLKPIFL